MDTFWRSNIHLVVELSQEGHQKVTLQEVEKKHDAVRKKQHLSACCRPLCCQSVGAKDGERSLLRQIRTRTSNQDSEYLRKQMSVFLFQMSVKGIQSMQM